MEALKVRDFPRNMKREDLSLSIERGLGPERKSFREKAAFRRAITFANDWLVRVVSLAPNRQGKYGPDVITIEVVANRQFCNQGTR